MMGSGEGVSGADICGFLSWDGARSNDTMTLAEAASATVSAHLTKEKMSRISPGSDMGSTAGWAGAREGTEVEAPERASLPFMTLYDDG